MRSVFPAFSGLESNPFTSAAAFSVSRTIVSLVALASIYGKVIAAYLSVKLLPGELASRRILDRFALLLLKRRRDLRQLPGHSVANLHHFLPFLHLRCQPDRRQSRFLRPELIPLLLLQIQSIQHIHIFAKRAL